MPVILAIQETDARRIAVGSQCQQIVCKTSNDLERSQKKPEQKGADGVAQGLGPGFKPQYCQKERKKEMCTVFCFYSCFLGTTPKIHGISKIFSAIFACKGND
jgi:hypothetical protein